MTIKSSENDQLTGHFQSFFYLFFSPPLDPKSEQNSDKSTDKKFWPKSVFFLVSSL